MIDEKKIRYIMAINEYRNITKASEALYISQPALSRMLLDIEKDLGTPLFIRDHGTLHLTYAGEIYIDACQKVMNTYDSACRKIQDITDPDRGMVTLAMTSTVADAVASFIIQEFGKQYPNTKLVLTEEKGTEIEEIVRIGKADIGLTYRNAEPDLEHIMIDDDEVLAIAPGRDENSKKTISIYDLQGQNVILLKKGRKIREQVDTILDKYHVQPNILLETDSLHLCIEMALDGQGYSFSPNLLLNRSAGYSQAVRCTISEERIDRPLYMIRRKDSYFSRSMNRIQEILSKACGYEICE